MGTKKCPFCNNEELVVNPTALSLRCFCSNCGIFILPLFVCENDVINLENFLCVNNKANVYKKRHLIAGWMYEFNRDKSEPLIFNNSNDFEDLLSDGRMPKTPMQRLERLLLNLYKFNDKFGSVIVAPVGIEKAYIKFTYNKIEMPNSMAYAADYNEVSEMIFGLESLGYLRKTGQNNLDFKISPQGFERAEQLLNSNIESTNVFVAMQFSDDLLEAFREAIKPACEACGFDALIISDKSHNNGITDEIIVEIKRSKFVIVDFTYNNNGAYWEAGFSQGLGRPVIRCCKREWFDGKSKIVNSVGEIQEVANSLHFDVRHYNTIIWEDHDDLAMKLKNNIRANFSDAKLRTRGQA